tara:strand:+ start:45760 stop:46407 length:648 start_codon:yes stop_codon:yes gene_type:complete
MKYENFGAAKANTPHSTIATYVFKQRAVLLSVIGLLAIAALYVDIHGATIAANLGYTLTGLGILLLAFGLFIRLWASLYIVHNRNKNLVCSGPYSIIRNPLYLGNFIAVTGALVMTGSIYATLAVLAGMTFVYYFTIRYEDERLEHFFGDQFVEFRNRVPRVLPSVRSLRTLVTNQDFDSISYNNVGNELARAFQVFAIVTILMVFTYTIRHNLL